MLSQSTLHLICFPLLYNGTQIFNTLIKDTGSFYTFIYFLTMRLKLPTTCNVIVDEQYARFKVAAYFRNR